MPRTFALLDFRFRQTAPMQVLGGRVSLVGSSFEDIAGGSAIENRGGSLVLAGVETQGIRVITEQPGGWQAGPSHPGSREIAGQTVWIKR